MEIFFNKLGKIRKFVFKNGKYFFLIQKNYLKYLDLSQVSGVEFLI